MGKALSSNQTSQGELKYTMGHSSNSGLCRYQDRWRRGNLSWVSKENATRWDLTPPQQEEKDGHFRMALGRRSDLWSSRWTWLWTRPWSSVPWESSAGRRTPGSRRCPVSPPWAARGRTAGLWAREDPLWWRETPTRNRPEVSRGTGHSARLCHCQRGTLTPATGDAANAMFLSTCPKSLGLIFS